MIAFSFADLQRKARWEKLGFDGKRHQIIVDGLNLAGFCRSKIVSKLNSQEQQKKQQECQEYNVLPIGFVNTTQSGDDDNELNMTDIKKLAVRVNQGIITHEGIKKLYDFDHDHNRICPKCDKPFQLRWYEEAIFYKCKYRISFKMNKQDQQVAVEGLIAHQTKYAKFDRNLRQCRALLGNISALQEDEEFCETFIPWLWQHDL